MKVIGVMVVFGCKRRWRFLAMRLPCIIGIDSITMFFINFELWESMSGVGLGGVLLDGIFKGRDGDGLRKCRDAEPERMSGEGVI